MRNPWPVFKTHAEVVCFACGGGTENTQESGSPPGGGAYQRWCAACRLWTWYDRTIEIDHTRCLSPNASQEG